MCVCVCGIRGNHILPGTTASSVLAPVEGPADQKNQVFDVNTFFHWSLGALYSISRHPSYFMLPKHGSRSILSKLQPFGRSISHRHHNGNHSTRYCTCYYLIVNSIASFVDSSHSQLMRQVVEGSAPGSTGINHDAVSLAGRQPPAPAFTVNVESMGSTSGATGL